MIQHLITVAVDWATRCFGTNQMTDPPTRALRLVEEAIEFAQAVGVEQKDVHACTADVYSREPGDPYQELGGVYMTAHLLSHVMARVAVIGPHGNRPPLYIPSDGVNPYWTPDEVFNTELCRVLDKEAKNPGTFAKRNAQKINLMGGARPGPGTIPRDPDYPLTAEELSSPDETSGC